MKVFSLCTAAMLVSLLLLSACGGSAQEPNPEPDKAQTGLPVQDIRLGTAVFHCELALNPESRRTGLMFRSSLDAQTGMLFVFPDEVPRNFWMKNTQIPLSIAYINRQGVVKTIVDMTPFSENSVPSTYSVAYALEVNQGAFSRLGIKVGDTVDTASLSQLPRVNQ